MSNADRQIHSPEPPYEKRDANIRSIMIFGVLLITVTVVVLLLMRLVFNALATREARLDRPPPPLAETREPHTEPQLQVNPTQDLSEMRNREDELLNNYAWVNKETGVVRIPIDRAMELLIERGLPVMKPAEGAETRQSSEGKETEE